MRIPGFSKTRDSDLTHSMLLLITRQTSDAESLKDDFHWLPQILDNLAQFLPVDTIFQILAAFPDATMRPTSLVAHINRLCV